MSGNPPPPSKPRWTFVSVALFVIGLLILVPTGLCVALAGILAVTDRDLSVIPSILLFAALPMLVGGAIIYAALKARKQG
jgi:hypothetical protein